MSKETPKSTPVRGTLTESRSRDGVSELVFIKDPSGPWLIIEDPLLGKDYTEGTDAVNPNPEKGVEGERLKPSMETYGWHNQDSFDGLPSGWYVEGGEEAYFEALKEWEESQVKEVKEDIPNASTGDATPRCAYCRFWRDKGWNGDEGIGTCHNPTVIKQVSMMNEEMIKRFVIGDTEQHKKAHAVMIANSLRFHSHYGCIHHQEEA